jgi:NAD+ kinase
MVDSGPLGVIILLEASDERLLERVRHRRIDPETHTVYNMKFYPPEEEEITERLLHIPADEPEAFRRRLAQFRASLPALLAYITEAAKEVRNDSNGDAHLIRLDVSRPGVRERFLELEERLWRGKGLRRLSEWQEDSFRDTAMVPHASMSFARARAAGLLNRADMAALSAWSDEVAQVTENGDLMDTGSQQVPTGLERSSRNPSRTADDAATIKASSHADERAPSTGGTMDSSPASSAQRDAVPTSDGMGPRVAGPAAGDRQTKKPQTKASITLIRCDGVQCVRETVHHGDIAFHGSATEQVMLRWNERPRTVLLLVKKGAHLSDVAKQAVDYLQNVEMLQVLVEPWVQTELFALGTYVDSFHHAHELHSNVDLVVCLGGDGLILYASTLFRTAVPPVAPFNLGSLGFLTPFEWKDFPDHIRAILSSDLMLSLRMRLMATVVRASGNVERQFHVLNEVVVDRGASPFLCQLECFWDDEPLASVQADGIIVASPTGSTAYSLAAGGAMVHPSVPAICVTPVCPHSLGLRPLVLPDSARIRVKVSPEARSHAWASFDGKHRLQLRRGDSLIVEMSKYPMPTVNATDHAADWFGSLIRGFGFNVRGAKPKPRLLGRSDTAEQPPRKGIEAKDE